MRLIPPPGDVGDKTDEVNSAIGRDFAPHIAAAFFVPITGNLRALKWY